MKYAAFVCQGEISIPVENRERVASYGVIERAAAVRECARIQAWHATYNAALTGVMARPGAGAAFAIAEARAAADLSHGEL